MASEGGVEARPMGGGKQFNQLPSPKHPPSARWNIQRAARPNDDNRTRNHKQSEAKSRGRIGARWLIHIPLMLSVPNRYAFATRITLPCRLEDKASIQPFERNQFINSDGLEHTYSPPFRPSTAEVASSSFAKVTNPMPRERPVSRSRVIVFSCISYVKLISEAKGDDIQPR